MPKKPADSPDSPDLAAEIAALRAELDTLLSMVTRLGKDGADSLRTRARAKAAEGKARAQEGWDEIEARIGTELHSHPWRTLGLAALGGFLLACLMRGGRR